MDSKKFVSKDDLLEQDLLDDAPEKVHGLGALKIRRPLVLGLLLDREEVLRLVLASLKPIEDVSSREGKANYSTFTCEEASLLVGVEEV